jgi:hypothetical protein
MAKSTLLLALLAALLMADPVEAATDYRRAAAATAKKLSGARSQAAARKQVLAVMRTANVTVLGMRRGRRAVSCAASPAHRATSS